MDETEVGKGFLHQTTTAVWVQLFWEFKASWNFIDNDGVDVRRVGGVGRWGEEDERPTVKASSTLKKFPEYVFLDAYMDIWINIWINIVKHIDTHLNKHVNKYLDKLIDKYIDDHRDNTLCCFQVRISRWSRPVRFLFATFCGTFRFTPFFAVTQLFVSESVSVKSCDHTASSLCAGLKPPPPALLRPAELQDADTFRKHLQPFPLVFFSLKDRPLCVFFSPLTVNPFFCFQIDFLPSRQTVWTGW